MDKKKLVESLHSQLRDQYQRAVAAVQDAADGARGDDAKAESKYDTRGLESSYLAAGQVEQAENLMHGVAAIENFEFPEFQADAAIDMGALVEGTLDGRSVYYLLAPAGGGVAMNEGAATVMTIGPQSPLTGYLLGKKAGDSIEQPPVTIVGVS